MGLTHDEIAQIALLARIGITDAEKQQYHKELSSIVAYFAQLQDVQTDDVEEVGHITGVTDVVRADVVAEPDPAERAAIMGNVPDVRDEQIAVKSIL